jgi:S-adenosylmethionine:tRNA-ribosyltransferase-isomerase (queuine synthetase)
MNKAAYISIEDYNYCLPEEKIAFFPCKNRDESRLLIFKDNIITEDVFKNVPMNHVQFVIGRGIKSITHNTI